MAQLIHLLLGICALSICSEAKQFCPACVDPEFVDYVVSNKGLFSDRSMAYPRMKDGELACRSEDYTKETTDTEPCSDSCLRIHLTKLGFSTQRKTIGWMFYCSTGVLKETPASLNIPHDLSHFKEDYNYTDPLTFRDQIEVSFYKNASQVELPKDYHSKSALDDILKKIVSRSSTFYLIFAGIVFFSIIFICCAFDCCCRCVRNRYRRNFALHSEAYKRYRNSHELLSIIEDEETGTQSVQGNNGDGDYEEIKDALGEIGDFFDKKSINYSENTDYGQVLIETPIMNKNSRVFFKNGR
ncbi:unnamed protein product [Caenorhabditis angaria]|uniref:Uncharacterized protein n=1 Tax=Caenorhabditis angaria TaxID=860376 RepID=A0A9P1J1D2_9PELO|nr:unnamed protein product [Caenorhabditis angaria]